MNLPASPNSVDELSRIRLNVFDQITDCDVGKDVDEDMDVIGHCIDLKDLLFPVCDDAGEISVNFGFVLVWEGGVVSL